MPGSQPARPWEVRDAVPVRLVRMRGGGKAELHVDAQVQFSILDSSLLAAGSCIQAR